MHTITQLNNNVAHQRHMQEIFSPSSPLIFFVSVQVLFILVVVEVNACIQKFI